MKHFIKLFTSFIVSTNSLTIIKESTPMINKNQYHNLFVLGDSLSDTGAFVQYQGRMDSKLIKEKNCSEKFRPLMRSTCYRRVNYWKAKSFSAPFYQNSFSNGPVAVQVLADLLGITNFSPGSYIPEKFNNFGYNYSTGAAKVLYTSDLLNIEFISHLQAVALANDAYNIEQQAKTLMYQHPKINKKDLLIINIGNNDLSEIVSTLSIFDDECTKTILLNRIVKIVDTIFLQVEKLIAYGFDRVVVFNNVDFSKTPRYTENFEFKKIIKEIVQKYNDTFNLKYNDLIKNEVFKQKIRKFDFNAAFEEILLKYIFKDKITKKAAVDIDWTTSFIFNDTFEPYYIDGASEENVDDYAFFDGVHPTGAFHFELARKLHNFLNMISWIN